MPGRNITWSNDYNITQHPQMLLKNLTIFKVEPTTPNMSRVVKRTQHVAPINVAICCVEMLRSFGRGFIGFQFTGIRPLWLMKTSTFQIEIKKQGAQSLRMKIRNAELYLKGATVVYGSQPLAARLPELASKLERIDCFHWFYYEYERE